MDKNDLKMEDWVEQRLCHIEETAQVRILYAVEAGSRARGLAGPASDYDVRFIYVHPRDWYLAIDRASQRDVLEYPIEHNVDIVGWDLRKALQLFAQSNPSVIEWLLSSVIYRHNEVLQDHLCTLFPQVFNPIKNMHHYRSIAQKNAQKFLKQTPVPVKKYLYIMQALLCVNWLERYQTPAPISIYELLHLLDGKGKIRQIMDELILQKRNGCHHLPVGRSLQLDQFIHAELSRLANRCWPSINPLPSSMSELNQLFLQFMA